VTVREIALRAAQDALALVGPSAGGMIRSADPVTLGPRRLALAREAIAVLGPDRTRLTAQELAERLVPRVRELIIAGEVE